MTCTPRQITLDEWDARYDALKAAGLAEPACGGRLSRHLADGDYRLRKLSFDNSPAALRLWNFLLTEEERLAQARTDGRKIVGVMKDLGTTAVMAYALPNVVAFYPDGAWWIPCVMENSDRLLAVADSLGIDDSFCPVRAMLGAFITANHFPIPDLLTCSVGATCDDFSAIAQRLEALGHKIVWWEIPHRRPPEPDEPYVTLPGQIFTAARSQVDFARSQLRIVQNALQQTAGCTLDDEMLAAAISHANRIRRLLAELRRTVYTAPRCPIPALEMLIAEMLAIHYCSNRDQTAAILQDLLAQARTRVSADAGFADHDAPKVFWVNPVADLRAMNILEQCGARLCGTEYMFTHALDPIPEDVEPLEALARAALADPMIGSARDRAARIAADARDFHAEAVIVSRIPGASHCALEGRIIADHLRKTTHLPVLEIEIPPLTDAVRPAIATRIEALVETVKHRRRP